jgi:uncharacterized protein YqhQ
VVLVEEVVPVVMVEQLERVEVEALLLDFLEDFIRLFYCLIHYIYEPVQAAHP